MREKRETADRQQMLRDQQSVSRGPGITGWRSRLAIALSDGSMYGKVFVFSEKDTELEANGPRSEAAAWRLFKNEKQ